MKFESFLLTEGRIKQSTFEDAQKLLTGKHSDAYKTWLKNKGRYIFRGTGTLDTSYAYGNAKGSRPRRSANTTNHSTLWFSNHPSWNKFPRRDESFICSTDPGKAEGYGTYAGGALYHVFPENGTDIGVCPDRDIFDSFDSKDTQANVYYINQFIVAAIENSRKILGASVSDNDVNWKYMKYTFDSIKMAYDTSEFDEKMDYRNSLIDQYFSPEQFDGDIESLLADVYDPKKNKFKIVKSGQPIERLKEVWMGGNCLFVHDKDIVDIK